MAKRQDITPSVVRKVRARTMMRDHKLHGTATLFVALTCWTAVCWAAGGSGRDIRRSSGSSTPNTPLATNRLRALLHKRQTVAILLPGWPLRR